MAEYQGLESGLRTTEALLEKDFAKWNHRFPQENHLEAEYRRSWPHFTKRIMRGSTHYTPQSVICIPTPFMRQHPDTFQAGNLITLQGPSGNTWKVRASDKPIVHSGWRAFAHDHDLREGDHLCFNLTRASYFVVEVFCGNGEVKGAALRAINTGKYSVASINNPCEYVRRSRKRKPYGAHGPTIASRCKTTARRRNPNEKLWLCRKEMDGREVVTILDSDDDQGADSNRVQLGNIQLSFGSAQVQRYRWSTISRLVEYMKAQGEWSVPKPDEDQRIVLASAEESEKLIASAIPESQPDPRSCPDSRNQEEGETPVNVERGIDLETMALQEAHAAPLGLLPENPYLTPMSASENHTLQGELMFAALQSIVDMPEIADTTSGGHPLMRDLINHELAQKSFAKDDVNKRKSPSENELDIIASKLHKPSYGYSGAEDETKQQYLHFLQPPKPTIGRHHHQFRSSSSNVVVETPKPPKFPPARDLDICVLESNRGKVGNLDREKTLKAAQAWTKKLRNPRFVAVMQPCNVYYGFIMDIPGEFARKARLPATETKAMLICDEVPTMCRAVWDGAGAVQARGWMEFSRTHYLEEGDVCVFELHNRAAVRIGVHIFRVAGLRRSLADWTRHYNVVHLGANDHVPRVLPGSTAAAALQVL